MTTHEEESQLLEQDQENYIATNPKRDTQKNRKGGLLMSQKILKQSITKDYWLSYCGMSAKHALRIWEAYT